QLTPSGKPGGGRVHRVFLDIQERSGVSLKRRELSVAMAAIRHFAQHMQYSGLHAQRKVAADTDLIGQSVRQEKADAMDLLRQRIGIFSNLSYRVGAINPIFTQRLLIVNAVVF